MNLTYGHDRGRVGHPWSKIIRRLQHPGGRVGMPIPLSVVMVLKSVPKFSEALPSKDEA